MKKTVLVGCAGTGTAFAAVSALRRTWKNDVKIVCSDINASHLVTAALLADVFEVVRPVSDQLYPVELERIIAKHKVTVYLPLMPEEVVIAASLKASLRAHQDLRILAPCEEFAVKVCDKWQTAQLLQGAGLPTPQTYLLSAASLPPQNLIAKPRFGCGSKGVRITQGGGQHLGDVDIFQEVCSGPEVTVDAFNDPAKGFTWSVCRERLETKSGVSTKCRLFRDTELNELAASLAKVAKLVGSFCFQVMRRNGLWMIIDVNPRPGAATNMCLTTGNDFFSATFALAFGEDYERYFNDFSGECFVTRQYADFRS
jgi:predicted ATP-grasp superfamily ATP-dependent carboligase